MPSYKELLAEKARVAEAEEGNVEFKKSEASADQASPSAKLITIYRNLFIEIDMEVYVADNEESHEAVVNTIICGIRKLENKEAMVDELLGGFFTVLGTVSPDARELGKKMAKTLGFITKEIKVPSEHGEANAAEKFKAYSGKAGDFVIAQLVYLPFVKKLEEHELFWRKIALKENTKLDEELFVLLPIEKVEILYSKLKLSGLWNQFSNCMYDLQQSLMAKHGSSLGGLLKTVGEKTTPWWPFRRVYVLKKKEVK